MTDDEKTMFIIGTGAAGALRALSGYDGPAEVRDTVSKLPDVSGKHGRAWMCDMAAGLKTLGHRPEDDARVVHWVIEAPWAHPCWHSYSILVVHLRPMPDNRPTKFYLDGATHEMWVHSMNPDFPRDKLITGNLDKGDRVSMVLEPKNFAAQIIEITDELVTERIKAVVKEICDGKLSPDTDFLREWQRRFGNNMIKREYR